MEQIKTLASSRSGKYQLLALLFPVLILLGMLYMPLVTIANGEVIQLETRPVDPRDLFRGDHVMLSYQIESVPYSPYFATLSTDPNLLYGKTVYVSLKKSSVYHTVDTIQFEKPNAGTYLKGKVQHIIPVDSSGTDLTHGNVIIDYGLDNFFVPENTGKDLEEKARQGEVIATIVVKDGYGILKEVKAR